MAAASDSARPVLEGINVVFQQGQATFTAADTFRVAYRSVSIPDHHLAASLLIPASVLRQLARILPSSGVVRLGRSHDGGSLLVQTREMELSSSLMVGEFPNVRSLLSLSALTRVVLSLQDLRNVLRLMASFTRENRDQLRWIVETDAFLVEAEVPDLGTNEMRLTEGVTISGPAVSLLLNAAYIADALAAVTTPEVALEMVSDRHPVTIKPVGPLDARGERLLRPCGKRTCGHPGHPGNGCFPLTIRSLCRVYSWRTQQGCLLCVRLVQEKGYCSMTLRLDTYPEAQMATQMLPQTPPSATPTLCCLLHTGPLPPSHQVEVWVEGTQQPAQQEGSQHVFSWTRTKDSEVRIHLKQQNRRGQKSCGAGGGWEKRPLPIPGRSGSWSIAQGSSSSQDSPERTLFRWRRRHSSPVAPICTMAPITMGWLRWPPGQR